MHTRGGTVRGWLAGVAATCLLAGCGAAMSPQQPTPAIPATGGSTPTLSSGYATSGALPGAAALARAHLNAVANGIGGRYSGTPAEHRAADYVRAAFERLGYPVQTQPFTFNEGTSSNVVATKQGASAKEIVVGAHYDSVEVADGADDNASGVGVLLAAAELVREVQTPFTIRFVAFGAEEADDLFGSQHFVSSLDAAQRQAIIAMVNLDSVSAGDLPYVYGDAHALLEWIRTAAAAIGQPMETRPVSDLHEDADYYSFQAAGIPFVYFEATNWNLGDEDGFTQVSAQYGDEGAIIHTRFDTVDYLDATFPGRIDARLGLYTTVLVQALTQFRG